MCRLLVGVLFLSVVACRTPRGAESDPSGQIEAWEDRRSLGGGELLRLASAGATVATRVRALRALARIQDPQTVPTIVSALQDANPRVRSEAAFAAGQLGFSWDPLPPSALELLTQAVLDAEAREAVPELRVDLVEAMGKISAPAVTARLIERVEHPEVEVRAAALLGLAMPVRRGAPSMSPEAQRAALGRYRPELPDAERYAAAYALTFARLAAAEPALLQCLTDPVPEVRALCARGLGDIGAPSVASALGERIADPDARVASEAARALSKLANRCAADAECPAMTALTGLNARVDALVAGDPASAHPVLAFAQHFERPTGAIALAGPMRQRLLTAISRGVPTARTAALLDCRLAALWTRESGTLDEVETCGGAVVPDGLKLAWAISHWAHAPAGKVDAAARIDRLVTFLEHPAPAVRAAAFAALAVLKDASIAHRIRPLILSDDRHLAASAANLAGELQDVEALPPVRALLLLAEEDDNGAEVLASVGPVLLALKDPQADATFTRWLGHPHPHVRSVAAGALTTLRGTPVYPPRVERPGEAASAGAPSDRALKIRTLHGDIVVRLFTEEAPLTSHNFYRLAQAGYFKGHTFHRIVPNFVVQDGDPRGDGEGGPGYSIRCEINRRKYVRGTVGMALSGKDTGGSQFFITHSPQPHLDGRYTAFGEVVEGIDIADRLLEGDPVLEILPLTQAR